MKISKSGKMKHSNLLFFEVNMVESEVVAELRLPLSGELLFAVTDKEGAKELSALIFGWFKANGKESEATP